MRTPGKTEGGGKSEKKERRVQLGAEPKLSESCRPEKTATAATAKNVGRGGIKSASEREKLSAGRTKNRKTVPETTGAACGAKERTGSVKKGAECEAKESAESVAKGEARGAACGAKRAKTVFGVRLSTLLILSYIAAFLGWWVENLFRLIAAGVFDSRHQLLPFIPVYGAGFFALYALLGTPSGMRIGGKRILPGTGRKRGAFRGALYAATLFSLILISEMATGLFFEKAFGIRGWNYTSIPLHITRYTSVPTAVAFTAGIFLLMRFAFFPAVRLVDRIPDAPAAVTAAAGGILLAADWLVMLAVAAATGKFPQYWSFRFR